MTKRTLHRRGLNDARNITAREISWLAKEAPMSARNLEKIVKFQKRKFGVSFISKDISKQYLKIFMTRKET